MELRADFKRTEFGLIPNEWAIRSISELIESQAIYGHLDGNHGALYPRSNEFKSHGVPYVAANDFANGMVNFGTCKFLSSERAEKFKKGVAQNGDVLFAHNATVGPVALLETNLPYVILSTTATYFRCNPNVLSNLYLLGALQSPFFVNQYKAVMAQSTRYQVPITAQRKLSLVVPPLTEQNAIATTLSDVDALIVGLEKLIDKKRDLKQAAMQQLLTGQTRLPGFSGEWVEACLGDLARIQRGASPRPIESTVWFDDTSSVGWVRISDVTSAGMYLIETQQRLSPLGIQNSRPVDRGNLIMSICATVGRPVITEIDVCIHDGFVVFDKPQADKHFLYYVLKWIEPNWSKQGQTGSQMNLNTPLINGTKIMLPPTDEQKAIASALSEMDADLNAQESRLAKTRDLKQGMMQELLTGRTRLI